MGRGTVRVALYARVSTDEQNPEPQMRELRDYAERRGFSLRRIAARERLSPSGVRKMLKRAGVETAAAPAAAPASGRA
jgi:DNA invertase Pin-like site-specific DNA recombinase